MSIELSQAEQEAMSAGAPAIEATPPLRAAFREVYDTGWLAARDYYTGKGYAPRSMLRLQAAKYGFCAICGQPQPGSTEQPEIARAARQLLNVYDDWAVNSYPSDGSSRFHDQAWFQEAQRTENAVEALRALLSGEEK